MSKELGVYYTPPRLVDFVLSTLQKPINDKKKVRVLEPSCGDGRFISGLYSKWAGIDISGTLVELNDKACGLARKNVKCLSKEFKVFKGDFLNYKVEVDSYDLVIGNPPYIPMRNLTDSQRDQSLRIISSYSLPDTINKNIWVPFLLKAISALNENGVLVLVLPFELLQVKYCEPIQKFLEDFFDELLIYTFNKLIFPSAGQDTVVLVGKKVSKKKGLFIHTVDDRYLEKNIKCYPENKLCRKGALKRNGLKWSSLLLSDSDLNFISDIAKELPIVGDIVVSKPGIVTAANDFFIVDSSLVQKYKLEKFVKKILRKSLYARSNIIFSSKDFEEIEKKGNPSFFLDFSEYVPGSRVGVEKYLEIGQSQKINKRFKCVNREFWYKVPLVSPGSGVFFKRCNEFPKLLMNSNSIYTTDSAYNLFPKESYKMNSFIYSFYNPLTLCFSELLGRCYGGGVLELTPNEFRRLPIPYIPVCDKEFKEFKEKFDEAKNIHHFFSEHRKGSLSTIEFLDTKDIDRIILIYQQLNIRRLNK